MGLLSTSLRGNRYSSQSSVLKTQTSRRIVDRAPGVRNQKASRGPCPRGLRGPAGSMVDMMAAPSHQHGRRLQERHLRSPRVSLPVTRYLTAGMPKKVISERRAAA